MPEPAPTRRSFEKLQIERGFDDGTQRARRVRAEGSDSFVSDVAFPPCSVPSPVFVSARLADGCEISPSFHTVTTVNRLSKPMRCQIRKDSQSHRYCSYFFRLVVELMIL